MIDVREWLKSSVKLSVSVQELAEIVGVSRATMTRRIQEGLTADDLLRIVRHFRCNPVSALIEFGHITETELLECIDPSNRLLDTASDAELAVELAQRLASAKEFNAHPILQRLVAGSAA